MHYVGIPYTFGNYCRLFWRPRLVLLPIIEDCTVKILLVFQGLFGLWRFPLVYWFDFNFLSARFGRLYLGYILYIFWSLYSWLWSYNLVCWRCFSILRLCRCVEDLARFFSSFIWAFNLIYFRNWIYYRF